jgi:hypothetical protein
MKTITVIAAGFSTAGKAMGDLVDEGILKKDYSGTDITWTNISEDVVVKNEYDTLLPGESVTWEK